MSTVSGHPTIDQWPSCAVDMDANVYEHTHLRGRVTPAQPWTLQTTSTDSLTHFLEEPVCTLALSVIFNPQDWFFFLPLSVSGSPDLSYGLYDCDSCFCLAVGLFQLTFFLGEGCKGDQQIKNRLCFWVSPFHGQIHELKLVWHYWYESQGRTLLWSHTST